MGRDLPIEFRNRAAGLVLPPTPLNVEGLEITQVIQDMMHSVSLVARKPTVARVYLTLQAEAAPVSVSGEIEVQMSNTAVVRVPSQNTISIAVLPAQGLKALREDAKLSLNFLLPPAVLGRGQISIRLASVVSALGQPVPLTPGGKNTVTVSFIEMPPLRVKILGLRYRAGNPAVSYEPTERDYLLTLSWLHRVYPVADVVSTRLVVDSTKDWPFDCTDANLQLAAIRRQDMSAGADPRTHYFGLVADANGNNFMRGCASDVPDHPAPDTVASGPAGSNSWGWDFDGSYADWYTGHELGHTFGRAHPGFCNGNSHDDLNFPFPSGLISDAAETFVGFDIGDAALGLPTVAIPGVTWTDVMTYCERQWMCSYTYGGILQRLIDENRVLGASLPLAGPAQQSLLQKDFAISASIRKAHFLALVNEAEQTAKIQVFSAIERGEESRSFESSDAVIEFVNRDNQVLSSRPLRVKMSTCCEGEKVQKGMIDAIVSVPSRADSVRLLLHGREADRLRIGGEEVRLQSLRPLIAQSALSWESQDDIRYTIQTSMDGGSTWETLAVSQATARFVLEKRNYPGQSSVLVRIIASRGLQISSTIHSVELN